MGIFRRPRGICLNKKGSKRPGWWLRRLFFAGTRYFGWISPSRKKKSSIFQKKKDVLRLGVLGITFCQFTYFMAIEASNAGTATAPQILRADPGCGVYKGSAASCKIGGRGNYPSLAGTFVIGTWRY